MLYQLNYRPDFKIDPLLRFAMQRVPLVARAIFLDLAASGLKFLVPGARIVALFALGTGQSNNISWHGFVLLLGLNRIEAGNIPARHPIQIRPC